jgi:hypothetical protein
MVGFDDILKSEQWHQSIQKSLDVSPAISEMMKASVRILDSFSGAIMITELAKSARHTHKIFENQSLLSIEAAVQSLSLQAKIAMPQTTIDAISSINRQHEQLFGGIRAMTETLKIHSSAIAQINNLNFALSGISGQIAAIAAQQKNWTIIDDFEEVTEQAIEFSESLTEEITEEQQRQFQILLSLIVAFCNKHKTLGKVSFRVMNIFLILAGIHQYYDFLKEKPELATKAEVNQISIKQDSIIHFIQILSEELIQTEDYRITNRICEVKLKPKKKTMTVSKLPKDFELVVLQVNHKWVLVSYFDPKDNLPQTGWIMKKFLDKP